MNRREFTGTVLTYGLLQMLWARDLFATDVKPIVGQWFNDLNTLGNDLKGKKLKDLEFQAKMEELYKKVDLAELVKFVELDRIAEKTKLPANGGLQRWVRPGQGRRTWQLVVRQADLLSEEGPGGRAARARQHVYRVHRPAGDVPRPALRPVGDAKGPLRH